jgi:flagellar hook-length control protein FliK
MNNVAGNLVATLMQNNFSSKSNQLPNAHGLSQSNFSSILKQSKQSFGSSNQGIKGTRDKLIEPKEDAFSKSIDHMQNRFNQKAKAVDKQFKSKFSTSSDAEVNEINSREASIKNGSKGKVEKTSIETNDVKNEEAVVAEIASPSEEAVLNDEVELALDESEISEAMENQLLEDVANSLVISVEELSNLLSKLHMNMSDIFNPAKFKELMQAALNISSSTDLLTSGNALEKLQHVVATLGQYTEGQTGAQSSDESTVAQNDVKNGLTHFLNHFQDTAGAGQSGNGASDHSMTASGQNVSGSVVGLAETSISGTFEGILNQVITQKTETIMMNGTIATITKEITAKEVLDQIVTGMKVHVSEGKSKIVLQLNPENLGKIALSLTHEKGSISGQFIAESEAVKKVIEANLSQLKNQLQSQGIQVNELKIIVGNSTAFFAGEQEKGNENQSNGAKRSRRINNISNISSEFADTLIEQDDSVIDNFIHENSSIELHA